MVMTEFQPSSELGQSLNAIQDCEVPLLARSETQV